MAGVRVKRFGRWMRAVRLSSKAQHQSFRQSSERLRESLFTTVSPSAIHRYENEGRVPDPGMLLAFSRQHGIAIEWIFRLLEADIMGVTDEEWDALIERARVDPLGHTIGVPAPSPNQAGVHAGSETATRLLSAHQQAQQFLAERIGRITGELASALDDSQQLFERVAGKTGSA